MFVLVSGRAVVAGCVLATAGCVLAIAGAVMAAAPRKVPRTAAEVTKSLWRLFIIVSCPFRLEISQNATTAKIAEPGRLTGKVTGKMTGRVRS